MAKFPRYVQSRPGEIARLAKAVGVSHSQISRIVHGERGASLSVALAIDRATAGEITVADVARAKRTRRRAKKPGRQP